MILNDDELLCAKNIDDLKEIILKSNNENDADKIKHIVKIIDDVDKEIKRDTELLYNALTPIISYLLDNAKIDISELKYLTRVNSKEYTKNISHMWLYDLFTDIAQFIEY